MRWPRWSLPGAIRLPANIQADLQEPRDSSTAFSIFFNLFYLFWPQRTARRIHPLALSHLLL